LKKFDKHPLSTLRGPRKTLMPRGYSGVRKKDPKNYLYNKKCFNPKRYLEAKLCPPPRPPPESLFITQVNQKNTTNFLEIFHDP